MSHKNLRSLLLFFSLAVESLGAETVDLEKLGGALDSLRSYQYGSDHKIDLVWVERQVGMASVIDGVSDSVEKRLLKALSKAKTNDAEQFYLRQLRTIGTKRSVPHLRRMLTDPDMSHMARYALGGMTASEAGRALRRALSKTSGKLQAGIISTLVEVNDKEAEGRILELVEDPCDDVTLAAIRAAGHFGGLKAMEALRQARLRADETRQTEIDSALLTCAAGFAAGPQPEVAKGIYQDFYSGNYKGHVRVAGLQGLASLNDPDIRRVLIEAIQSGTVELQSCAVDMMAEVEGTETTETFIQLADTISTEGQVLILRALTRRGDLSSEPQIIKMTQSGDRNVRLAALEALGDLGSFASVPALVEARSGGVNDEADMARSSLIRLQGDDINGTLIRLLESSGPDARAEICWALGERHAKEAWHTLLGMAFSEPDDSARAESILAMGKIARIEDIDALLDLAISPRKVEDRQAVKKAVNTLFEDVKDKNAQADPVIAALNRAPDDAKAMLMDLLVGPATLGALQSIRNALTSPALREGAVRALSQWPNANPAEDLFEIASSETEPVNKILALRGFIRMALFQEDPTGMLVRALKVTEREEEIKSILSALGHSDSLQALELAESFMAQEAFRPEATLAAVGIASQFCWLDAPRSRALLDRVKAEGPTDSIKEEAQEALEAMEKYRDYLFVWQGAGPYTIDEVFDGRQVFDTAFEPEKDPESANISWVKVKISLDGGRIDLEDTFGEADYCCAYLRTTVVSPEDQAVKIVWAADDYIKGWVNGVPTQGEFVQLHKGENKIMLKVGDHGGGWFFSFRLTKPDGSAPEGLQCERE